MVEGRLPADLAATAEQAQDYIRQAKAANTLRAYRADWTDFAAWCEARTLRPLPAERSTVAFYRSWLAERCKTSTLQRRLSAIAQAHKTAGFDPPMAGDQAGQGHRPGGQGASRHGRHPGHGGHAAGHPSGPVVHFLRNGEVMWRGWVRVT